ncbi:MAG: response regulator [Phycisphaerae bacterium]
MNASHEPGETACLSKRNAAPTGRSLAVSSGAPTQTKPRVLLVDDENSILSALRRLLRRENYELLTASCGQEALEHLEYKPVQLVISDYRMPAMTGIQLLGEIRDRWPDTLRIILSGYSEVSAIIAAINDGAIYKFISKPWNDEEIKLHIRRALEQHQLSAENKQMAEEILEQNKKLLELNRLLEQRAVDACQGLSLTQDIIESIGVGVLMVDPEWLVVGANKRAYDMISANHSELVGISAKDVFPNVLYEWVRTIELPSDQSATLDFEHQGQAIKCRANSVMAEGNYRGVSLTLLEEGV